MRAMVFATPIVGSDGYMVDLDCGHRIATREQRVDYHCRACDGPLQKAPVVAAAPDLAAGLLDAHAALATERERAEAATTRADALAAQLDGLREAAARVRAACAATKDAGAAFDRAGRTYAHTRSDDDGDAMERADAVCRAAWQERFAAEAALNAMLAGCP